MNRFLGLILLALTSGFPPDAAASPPQGSWQGNLGAFMAKLDSEHPGEFGLFVKDLASGEQFSYRADEWWYVASGIKLPVAIEVLRQVDYGVFSLESTLRLDGDDYVDGAGPTNYKPPGSLLAVRYLLEQMLVYSDNTATDLLIKRVGLDNVNQLVRQYFPAGFSPITTLADVRRHAYAGFHPRAFALTSADLLLLKQQRPGAERVRMLATVLDLAPGEMAHESLSAAFDAYYATRLNSASLRAYGRLLETVADGSLLERESHERLLALLGRVKTGSRRIKAGLPRSIMFAHKTGTQHATACDFGLAWKVGEPHAKPLAVAACIRGDDSLTRAEKGLQSIGEAIYRSGVFSAE